MVFASTMRPSAIMARASSMEGSSTSEFAFKPEVDQTAVTWSMSGHQNFIAKAMCLVMNGKKMMSDIMDKGLANMKSVVEGASKT